MALLCARHLPAATVYGADISTKAVRFARMNARSYSISNVRFVRGDLFEPLPRKLAKHVDLVCAHPPYVARGEVRHVRREMRYEPPEAITDSSKDGLGLIGRIVREAPMWLAGGGWLLIQVVGFRARPVAAVLREAGFSQVRHLRPEGEYDRVIVGRLMDATH